MTAAVARARLFSRAAPYAIVNGVAKPQVNRGASAHRMLVADDGWDGGGGV